MEERAQSVMGLPWLIAETGNALDIPREIISVALHYYHRVCKKSIGEKWVNSDICGAACISLACKVQETPQTLRDILNILELVAKDFRERQSAPVATTENRQMLFHIKMPQKLDRSYYELKNEVLKHEYRILAKLEFNVEPPTAHEYMIMMVTGMNLSLPVIHFIWIILNDLYLDPLCLGDDFEVAAASILVAITSLPKKDLKDCDKLLFKKSWLVDFELNEKNVLSKAEEIIELYEKN